MLKLIQRFLTVTLLIFAALFFLYQGFLFMRSRELMPPGMGIAGVDVSGLTSEEAATRVNERYFSPISVVHQGERVPIKPVDVGFAIDIEGMIQLAQEYKNQQEPWEGFVTFLLKRPFASTQIELRASHDRNALIQQLENIASFLDQPARAPQLLAVDSRFQDGQNGFVTDVAASLPAVEMTLYRSEDREAVLVVNEEAAPEFGLELLQQNLEQQLQGFAGVPIVFIMDLETGDEISINADLPISGLSILKIAIFLETYRVFEGVPNQAVQELLYQTAVFSSNFDANLLLHVIAGQDNTYLGAELLTDSLQELGLVNTFMMIPYDAPVVATRPSTMNTPANSRPDLITFPDPARQTTAEEIGTLLSMIYYCAQGGGALLAAYPGDITPQDCQAIIDLMVQNTEGNLIRFGVPENVPVSHKHGWDSVTHGDAGIVFSPGGAYVIVYYLHQPQNDFLVSEYSFPILWELSRTTYNYFNFDNPNLEDPLVRAEREAEVREAEALLPETAVPDNPNTAPDESNQ
jgi:beta-lactamase class A